MTKPRKSTASPAAQADAVIGAARPSRNVPKPAPEDVKLKNNGEPEVLDLSARAAARAAARGTGPKVKVGAVVYELPPELKLATLEGVFAVVAGDIGGIHAMLVDLFGEAAVTPPVELEPDELAALTPAQKRDRTSAAKAYNPAFGDLTIDDLAELFGVFAQGYGIDLGNSAASTTS